MAAIHAAPESRHKSELQHNGVPQRDRAAKSHDAPQCPYEGAMGHNWLLCLLVTITMSY